MNPVCHFVPMRPYVIRDFCSYQDGVKGGDEAAHEHEADER